MSDLAPWKDQEILKIKQDIDNLLTCFMQDFSHPALYLAPPRIVTLENENEIIVKMNIPDLLTESLEVTLINNELLIKGEQTDGGRDPRRPTTRQRNFYSRTSLPGDFKEEHITAVYRDDMLIVTLPKKDPSKPQKIKVSIDE